MSNEKVIGDFGAMLGDERVIVDKTVLQRESIDYVGYRNWERYKGRYNAKMPICVVKPQDVEQISSVLRYLNENSIIAMPKTGGSCATAGLEVIDNNTVIVDASDMNGILDVSEENMTVTVQCGVALEYLEAYLFE